MESVYKQVSAFRICGNRDLQPPLGQAALLVIEIQQ
jgi:hypothetical protein